MRKKLYFNLAVLAIAIAALINIFIQAVAIPELGDGKLIALILSNRELFPAAKYLAGIETLRVGYAAIWQFPPIARILPGSIANHAGFIRIAGISVMACTSIYLLTRYPSKYRVLLAATTPIWILFSFGYLEYYPFIAGGYLALLCWLFNGNFEEKSEIQIGVVTGVLPLIYLGFAPLSFIILFTYLWRARIEIVMRTLGALLLAFFIGLRLFWPKSLSDYFTTLYQELNFGDTNTIYEGYRGLAASETSIFFNTDYVFSLKHFKELFHMLGLGLGLTPIVILFVALALSRKNTWCLSRKNVLAILITGWSLLYFAYTIPKLGPILDVDMFFMTYITIAFFSGATLDINPKLKSNFIIPLHLLSTAFSCVWLMQTATK
ncbi:MAG: hypothetical protein Q8R10_14320 [Pseudomonas sp.]|uniref:hypothetical protein n=1 Tax=Pseudomonas sp. TaxID=306 RepID=UPI0027327577|nr:hypothetical protein [Pseudomonas sp.]MDP3847590.1 hypothetical protein [Pseudomonas sp.]